MKIVGITGRSGSGKSSLSAYLTQKGYPVADADMIAREVLEPGSGCLPLLREAFGDGIFDQEGNLLRRTLADRAFATPEGTARLTAITLPEILSRIDCHAEESRRADCKLFFVDGAVIVGTAFEQKCDRLIVVKVPNEVAVARICTRDGITAAMAQRRLDAQLPQERLDAAADFLLVNDTTPAALAAQADAILTELTEE